MAAIDELSQFELKGVKEVRRSGNNQAGSYGFVFQVKVDGRVCIAKKPHSIFLTDVSEEERSRVVANFQKECILLSKLKHPNIVKFVGIYYGDKKRRDLILVMEKLSSDLVQFMERHKKIALDTKLAVLRDVASGLTYLHEYEPPIVHRDLTAMNVLLTDSGQAKIVDVGVAKPLDARAMMASKHTRVPGQMFYMPPETRFEKPQCTPKLDVFSFGHLTLHFVLERFPEVFEIPHSQQKEGIIEQQKRRAALEDMGSGHCLYSLTMSCLQDDPNKRPSSRDVWTHIQSMVDGGTTAFDSNYGDEHYYKHLPLAEKHYKCERYITLDEIETWSDTRKRLDFHYEMECLYGTHSDLEVNEPFPLLNSKVSLWQGDITCLEIDAIVNATSPSLSGDTGVDAAVHRAAGHSLYDECLTVIPCPLGQARLTSGHALPAKYVIHAVGYGGSEKLRSCYSACLDLVEKHNIQSVAFCCIATGSMCFPNEEAAKIALNVVREWLEVNSDKVERIIFCVFLEKDLEIYRRNMLFYFPEDNTRENQLSNGTQGDYFKEPKQSGVPEVDAVTDGVDKKKKTHVKS